MFRGFEEYYVRRGKTNTIQRNNSDNMVRLFKIARDKSIYSYGLISNKNFEFVVLELQNAGISGQKVYKYDKSLWHFIKFEKKRYQHLMTPEGDWLVGCFGLHGP